MSFLLSIKIMFRLCDGFVNTLIHNTVVHYSRILATISSIFLMAQHGQAQSLPIGLYEGLLGNTGVALMDSKAASFYNPSLLRYRKDDNFSLGGTTLASSTSKNSETRSRMSSFTPSYLSSIYAGHNLNHELFFINKASWQLSSTVATSSSGGTQQGQVDTRLTESHVGYSMAFLDFPLGMQFVLKYAEQNHRGFFESELNDGTTVVSSLQSDLQKLGFSLGLSSHIHWTGYTLGVNYQSRALGIYEKPGSKAISYFPNAGDLIKTVGETKTRINFLEGHRLIVGHGFHIKNHDFLLDTMLEESGHQLNLYSIRQGFGYRWKAHDQHQFFCGLNHGMTKEVKSIGDDIYVSTGYAWRARKLQSSIGAFYLATDLPDRQNEAYGLTFSSEFAY